MALKGMEAGYYVITPSKYLHQFSDDDDVRKDPSPDLSLYLPDCTIGAINGDKFSIKGKDASKGKMGSAMAMSHELNFKAHTAADAEKWYSVIREASSGGSGLKSAGPSTPTSPVESRNVSAQQQDSMSSEKQPPPLQTQQQDGGSGPASGSAGPMLSPQSASTSGVQDNTPNSGVERQPGQY